MVIPSRPAAGDVSWKFSKKCYRCCRSTLFVAFMILFVPSGLWRDGRNETTLPVSKENKKAPIFSCPSTDDGEQQHGSGGAKNYKDSWAEETYIKLTAKVAENITNYLENFHTLEFDAWGKSFADYKAEMYPWKAARYPQYLKSGDSIYESASGLGLNLLMTLEILQEHGVAKLTVYGNEFVAPIANISNQILDARLPFVNATKGSICAGDSSHLHFVPSNSMDLAYTGYITSTLDPLGLNKDLGYYRHICTGTTLEEKRLVEAGQQKQNEWFALWASEMIRIAKPGAPARNSRTSERSLVQQSLRLRWRRSKLLG